MSRFIHIRGILRDSIFDEHFKTEKFILDYDLILLTSYAESQVNPGEVLLFRGTSLQVIYTLSKSGLLAPKNELPQGHNGFLFVKCNSDASDFLNMVLDRVSTFGESNIETKMWIISKEEFRKRQLRDLLS